MDPALPPSPVYFSVGPGQVAADGPEGSYFAQAVAAALKRQAQRPYSSIPDLLADIALLRSDSSSQFGWYEGPVDAGPLCPPGGPLRVHLVIQADYSNSGMAGVTSLHGAERQILPDAFRGGCDQVELTEHLDLSVDQLRKLSDVVVGAAREKGGRTLVYLSGHGFQLEGRSVFLGTDAQSPTDWSLDIGRLAIEIGADCANTCSIWVDASRVKMPGKAAR